MFCARFDVGGWTTFHMLLLFSVVTSDQDQGCFHHLELNLYIIFLTYNKNNIISINYFN